MKIEQILALMDKEISIRRMYKGEYNMKKIKLLRCN